MLSPEERQELGSIVADQFAGSLISVSTQEEATNANIAVQKIRDKVLQCLDAFTEVELKFGMWVKFTKSITVHNGVEAADYEGIFLHRQINDCHIALDKSHVPSNIEDWYKIASTNQITHYKLSKEDTWKSASFR